MLVEEQTTPAREAVTPQHHRNENWKQKLPSTRVITSFPLGKHHESLAPAEGRLWTWAPHPTPPKIGKRLLCSFSRWEAWVSGRTHAVSFPQVSVLLPANPVSGTGDPGPLILLLAGGAQPLHQGTFRLSFAMDQHPRELHIFSPVCYFTPHAGMLQNTGTDSAWGHTIQAGVYAHLQHSLAFCGTYSPLTE